MLLSSFYHTFLFPWMHGRHKFSPSIMLALLVGVASSVVQRDVPCDIAIAGGSTASLAASITAAEAAPEVKKKVTFVAMSNALFRAQVRLLPCVCHALVLINACCNGLVVRLFPGDY